MYFIYYNHRYFLFSNDTIGKSEVIHTYVFNCTVSLNIVITKSGSKSKVEKKYKTGAEQT